MLQVRQRRTWEDECPYIVEHQPAYVAGIVWRFQTQFTGDCHHHMTPPSTILTIAIVKRALIVHIYNPSFSLALLLTVFIQALQRQLLKTFMMVLHVVADKLVSLGADMVHVRCVECSMLSNSFVEDRYGLAAIIRRNVRASDEIHLLLYYFQSFRYTLFSLIGWDEHVVEYGKWRRL
jgi:hypothetical protein